MGLGCAIENACVAAPSQGLGTKVTLLPNGSSASPAAILEFEPAAIMPHPHHEAIAVCTENLNADVMVMKSAEQGV